MGFHLNVNNNIKGVNAVSYTRFLDWIYQPFENLLKINCMQGPSFETRWINKYSLPRVFQADFRPEHKYGSTQRNYLTKGPNLTNGNYNSRLIPMIQTLYLCMQKRIMKREVTDGK